MALKIQEGAQIKFAELEDRLRTERNIGDADLNMDEGTWTTPIIGDLEPPLENVELLMDADVISAGLDIILDDDPLSSLFQYSLPRLKPPPPPPPPPPPKPPKAPKVKRGRKPGDQRKKKQAVTDGDVVTPLMDGDVQQPDSQEEAHVDLDTAPDPWMPRTRRATAAAAAAAAVEPEVDVVPSPKEEVYIAPVPSTSGPAKRGRPRKHPIIVAPEPEPEEDVDLIIVVDEPAINDLEEAGDREVKKHSRKKRVTSFPDPTDMLPMVEHVDNQQSFKMFNKGWILTPNTRRGGRRPMEKVEVPIKAKKRPRTGML